MKNWLLLSLGFSTFGFSQITIVPSQMPQTGDTLRMSNAVIDQNLDYQTTGGDKIWDFSNLVSDGQVLNDYKSPAALGAFVQFIFGNFAPTKYKASYYLPSLDLPFENLPPQIPITIKDVAQFYQLNADSMTMVGIKLNINGQEVPAKSDTIETKYKFPIEYMDHYISRGATKLDLNPAFDGQWRQHRKRETKVDGWGQITTPYGTYSVLRIHHKVEETDSFYVSFNGFGTWIRIPVPEAHEYEWRSYEQKEPLLLVKTSMVQGTENITSVQFRNRFVLGIEDKELIVSMYPNPVQDILQVSSEEIFNHYTILSPDGKVIETQKLSGANQHLIDVSFLTQGTYLLRLQSDNGTVVKSFVK